MTARDLLRRTPFRLAATFTVLFALTSIAIFGLLYAALRLELRTQITQRIEATLDALSAVDRDRGFEDLTDVVVSESASIRDADTVFLLVDKAGQYRAGNIRDIAVSAGPLELKRSALVPPTDRGNPDDTFIARWQAVSGGNLLVGESDGEIQRIDKLLTRHLLVGLGVACILAAAIGALFASRAQRRIHGITTALDAVSSGNLAIRVPLSRSGDDIDHIGVQLNRTIEKLGTLVENVNQSASAISHDLKKPISRLHQKLDRARLTAKQPAEFKAVINSALEDLDSIVATFEAFLRISQIEAGARRSRFQVVDLVTTANEVAEIYQAVAEDAGRSFEWVTPVGQTATVSGDRELLVQMLANVVENAIRHCPSGTRIVMWIELRDSGCVVGIADDGPGIPESERQNVFRRLYRLEPSRSTSGNGLGLSLVAAIAELHEATVALEDNVPGLKVLISFKKRA